MRRWLRGEGGGISIFVALLIPFLILVGGIATDVALLNAQKKAVQGQADLAAESAVMRLPDVADTRAAARAVMRANDRYGAPDLSDAEIQIGTHTRAAGFVPAVDQNDGAGANAVRVVVPSPFRAMLLAPVLGDLTVTREAVAMQQGVVVFTLRNTLLDVSTQRSVLDALLGQALGINAMVLNYTGLAAAKVKLSDVLGIARASVAAGAVTWGDVLAADVSVRTLLSPFLPAPPATGAGTVKLGTLLAVSPELAALRVGDVLPDVSLSVLDLVTATAALSAQNRNQRIAVSAGVKADPLLNVSLSLEAIRPPVTAVARVDDNPQMQARVSQATVDLQADAVASLIRVKAVLNLGTATATPLSVTCGAKGREQIATFQVATGAASLALNIRLDPNGAWQPSKDATPVTIAGRTQAVAVRHDQIGVTIPVENPVTLLSVTRPVTTVLADLKQQTEAQKASCTGPLGGLGCLIGNVVGGVLALLTNLLTGLNALLGNAPQIDQITNALLDALGIRVAPAELVVHSVSCGPVLVR